MCPNPSRRPAYPTYGEFLAADPRREGDALELGADWRQGDDRYRACWYERTGELTLERLGEPEEIDLEDFHCGVAGPVEVLCLIAERSELSDLLGPWPDVAPGKPRTVADLRTLLGLS